MSSISFFFNKQRKDIPMSSIFFFPYTEDILCHLRRYPMSKCYVWILLLKVTSLLILVHGKGNLVCGTDYKVGMEWAPHPPLPKTTGKKKELSISFNMVWGKRINHNRMGSTWAKRTHARAGGRGDKDYTCLFQQGRDKAVIPKKHENNFFVLFKIFL